MRGGEKLRQHGLVVARLTVFFHTNRNKPERRQHGALRLIHLRPMIADGLELVVAARCGAERAWRDGFAYTKAGIMLDDLAAAELRPRTLFDGDPERRGRLMGALDEINGRFGKFSAVSAAQGFKREWKLLAENKSLAWTTRIGDVPTVRAS